MKAALVAAALVLAASPAVAAPVEVKVGYVLGSGQFSPLVDRTVTWIPEAGLEPGDFERLAANHHLEEPDQKTILKRTRAYEGMLTRIEEDYAAYLAAYDRWLGAIAARHEGRKPPRQVTTARTAEGGRARADLPPGSWLVLVRVPEGDTVQTWLRRVDVKAGPNTVTLSNETTQRNAWTPSPYPLIGEVTHQVSPAGTAYAGRVRAFLNPPLVSLDQQERTWHWTKLGSWPLAVAGGLAVGSLSRNFMTGVVAGVAVPAGAHLGAALLPGEVDPVTNAWLPANHPTWIQYRDLVGSSDDALIRTVKDNHEAIDARVATPNR